MKLTAAFFPEYFTASQRQGTRVKATDYDLSVVDIKTFAALWELQFATVEHIQRYRRLLTKKEIIFREDPFDPRLKTHKLK